MLKHRYIDKICLAAAILMVVLMIVFMNAGSFGLRTYHGSLCRRF